jgi:type III secretory pathway component EscS
VSSINKRISNTSHLQCTATDRLYFLVLSLCQISASSRWQFVILLRLQQCTGIKDQTRKKNIRFFLLTLYIAVEINWAKSLAWAFSIISSYMDKSRFDSRLYCSVFWAYNYFVLLFQIYRRIVLWNRPPMNLSTFSQIGINCLHYLTRVLFPLLCHRNYI